MRPPIPLAALILALSIAGCVERALGPGDVSGSYGLLRYDGDSLPRSYATSTGCWARIVYGALVLSPSGTFGLQIVRSQTCSNSGLYWADLDASGTYGKVNGPWWALRDIRTGTAYLAWLKGTHVMVVVPQVPLLGTGAVEVEFAAGANQGNGTVVGEGTGNTGPPPPPDTGSVVVIIKP